MASDVSSLTPGQLLQQAIVIMIRDGTPVSTAFDNAEVMKIEELRDFVMLNYSRTDMAGLT